MEIQNLSPQPAPVTATPPKPTAKINIYISAIILIVSLVSGFWLSRFFPTNPADSPSTESNGPSSQLTVINEIKDGEDIKPGKVYGNSAKNFKDSAVGVVQKGSINGEGTHILVREGGDSQRVSLTSASVDLDLFIDKKVEVNGETNASKKTGWLLDVGNIKILE